MKHTSILSILAILVAPLSAQAVFITGQQTAVNEWTYNLTFAPLDNYSIFQPATTITLTGLFGVVSAAGPTSTDFPPPLDEINRDWSAEVLGGGTGVRWTHVGAGTGNFLDERHIFEFRVFADGATDGLVSLVTSGFSRDTNNPLPDGTFNLDITASVAGPVAPGSVVPEPGTLTLLALGLAGLAIGKARSFTRRWPGRSGGTRRGTLPR